MTADWFAQYIRAQRYKVAQTFALPREYVYQASATKPVDPDAVDLTMGADGVYEYQHPEQQGPLLIEGSEDEKGHDPITDRATR